MNGRNSNDDPIVIYQPDYRDDMRMKIMLDHSCDEWVIGTPEETRRFIKQLEAAVERAEQDPDTQFDNDD